MTNKFNVGDKVKFIRSVDEHKVGQVKTINLIESPGKLYDYGFEEGGYANEINLELVTPKLTKNQRITALEETVAKQGEEINELKLIVAQIRKPSTVAQEALDKADWERGEVEGVIQFEGRNYRKVDREARVGDVVVLSEECRYNSYHEKNTPYKVVLDEAKKPCIDNPDDALVYNWNFNRTPETVDVYELFSMSFDDLEDAPIKKSPNHLRAEVIEKAKGFVDSQFKKHWNGSGDLVIGIRGYLYSCEFISNKNTVVALLSKYEHKEVEVRGIAKCMPGDVFNEHIGKAIALGRALGLDVSEFECAVQPTEIVVGCVVQHHSILDLVGEVTKFDERNCSDYGGKSFRHTHDSGWLCTSRCKIINDTNAIYGGVE